MSFGQALYYCLGAYTAGSLGRFFGIGDMLLQMTRAPGAAFIAFVLGFLLARYRGIFYGLLSLALSMILRPAGQERSARLDRRHQHPALDGVRHPARADVGALRCARRGLRCRFPRNLLVNRYLNTPLGQLAAAIKDNEIRVEYMGASAREAIHVKYVIAAALSGIGGALAATTVGHIDPDMAYWTTSGEFIFINIIAGTGSVVAPFLGAAIFGIIHTLAYDISPNTWQMTLGAALLLVIVFLPDGLWSLFNRREAA